MPITISRVVGTIEIESQAREPIADIQALLEDRRETEAEGPSDSKRETLGGAVPELKLDANIKQLLAQLEDELAIVQQCFAGAKTAVRI